MKRLKKLGITILIAALLFNTTLAKHFEIESEAAVLTTTATLALVSLLVASGVTLSSALLLDTDGNLALDTDFFDDADELSSGTFSVLNGGYDPDEFDGMVSTLMSGASVWLPAYAWANDYFSGMNSNVDYIANYGDGTISYDNYTAYYGFGVSDITLSDYQIDFISQLIIDNPDCLILGFTSLSSLYVLDNNADSIYMWGESGSRFYDSFTNSSVTATGVSYSLSNGTYTLSSSSASLSYFSSSMIYFSSLDVYLNGTSTLYSTDTPLLLFSIPAVSPVFASYQGTSIHQENVTVGDTYDVDSLRSPTEQELLDYALALQTVENGDTSVYPDSDAVTDAFVDLLTNTDTDTDTDVDSDADTDTDYSLSLSSIISGIANLPSNIYSFFSNILESILSAILSLPELIYSFFGTALDNLAELLTNIVSYLSNIPDLISSVWESITNLPSQIASSFSNWLDSIDQNLANLYETVADYVAQEYEFDTDSFLLPEFLTDKFPFCIPFDIITAFSLLENTGREAPYIEYPIYAPNYGIDEVIVIDLSIFDDQAALLRQLETLLFIIGLAFVTRELIKG